MTPMNEPLNNLIDALREELKQYGEMLALLEQEQELVMERQTIGIAPCVAAINAQADTLRAVRHECEQRRRHLARSLQLCESVDFRELTARLPAEYRPLIQALVEENKELLVRVQQRARQNHLLLSRMVELMQRLITSILPGTGPATYGQAGTLLAPALTPQPLYEALG
jgi:flagellar biosynthesis/type III secretory pathway chaperone